MDSRTPRTNALREKLNIGTVLLTDPRLEVFALCDSLELALAAAEHDITRLMGTCTTEINCAEAAEARAREAEKLLFFCRPHVAARVEKFPMLLTFAKLLKQIDAAIARGEQGREAAVT